MLKRKTSRLQSDLMPSLRVILSEFSDEPYRADGAVWR